MDFVELDTGSTLLVICRNQATNGLIDLTGATVKLKYRLNGTGALQTKTMTVNAPGTLGQAQYTFLVADLGADFENAEVEITDAGGLIVTSTDTFHLTVRAKV